MPCFLVAYEQVQQALRAIQLSASLRRHEAKTKVTLHEVWPTSVEALKGCCGKKAADMGMCVSSNECWL